MPQGTVHCDFFKGAFPSLQPKLWSFISLLYSTLFSSWGRLLVDSPTPFSLSFVVIEFSWAYSHIARDSSSTPRWGYEIVVVKGIWMDVMCANTRASLYVPRLILFPSCVLVMANLKRPPRTRDGIHVLTGWWGHTISLGLSTCRLLYDQKNF